MTDQLDDPYQPPQSIPSFTITPRTQPIATVTDYDVSYWKQQCDMLMKDRIMTDVTHLQQVKRLTKVIYSLLIIDLFFLLKSIIELTTDWI